MASFSGIAGDPPPDPMSIRLAALDGRYRVATSGSRRSQSMASSLVRQPGQVDFAVPAGEQFVVHSQAGGQVVGQANARFRRATHEA